MRPIFSLMTALFVGACGSSAPDNTVRGDINGLTLELPPPTPFKPEEAALPKAAPMSNEAVADVSVEPIPKAKQVAAKEDAPKPPLPSSAKESDGPAEKSEPAPKAAAETKDGDIKLLPARVPLADAEVARTIERIGYPCGTVVSSNRVENPGGNAAYKIVCSSGASYQGTNKNGRLFFREWTGTLNRR